MIDCSKRIYNNFMPYINDDGEYLVYDNNWDNSIGFVESESGLKISKDYLARQLREDFLKILLDDNDNTESYTQYVEMRTLKILKKFKSEIHGFRLMVQDDFPKYEENGWKFLNFINETFISYVLITELGIENHRLISAIEEESVMELDDDSYIRWLIHEVEYPGESEEDWKKREEKEEDNYQNFSKLCDEIKK